MATPANNAAVLTNSLFLMECFLFFFTVTPCGAHCYPFIRKRVRIACSSDRPEENATASRSSVPGDSQGT